jgi:hypothetical protein
MNRGGKIVMDVEKLIELFAERCTDRETLDELKANAADQSRWSKAHGLFDRIRRKTLVAERAGDQALTAQYRFEEICAKTLYNLSGESAPFDADSPYWIVPNAIALARRIGVEASEVLAVVAV